MVNVYDQIKWIKEVYLLLFIVDNNDNYFEQNVWLKRKLHIIFKYHSQIY